MTMTDEKPLKMTAPGTIVLERMMPGPIERVWAYLTESDKRAKWIAAGEMDLRPGGGYEFIFDHDTLSEAKEETPEKYKDECQPGMSMQAKIIAVNAPRMLHMTWAEGGDEESEVKFELEEVNGKVRLTLTHSKLFERDLLIGVAAGWEAHIAIMIDNLEGVSPRPFWATHMALEDTYSQTLFAGA